MGPWVRQGPTQGHTKINDFMSLHETNERPTVALRYFAAARELCGTDGENLPLSAPRMRLGDLRELLRQAHPRLAPHLPRMRLAVNGDFADEHDEVRAGDEVVVLPPVAGGAPGGPTPKDGDGTLLVDIRATPLSLDEVVDAVRHPTAGGIAVFLGVVRDHADGQPVERLDYEAYDDLGRKEMRRILEGIQREHPGVRLAATHRTGSLGIGDTAVVVAASAPHRAEAFTACRLAIDRIKETVPVWKKEWAPGGRAHWVNLEASPGDPGAEEAAGGGSGGGVP